MAKYYIVKKLSSKEDKRIWEDFGSVFLDIKFPKYSLSFWNITVNIYAK